jgi:uncharacterized protein (TIGR03066 family)
MRTLIGIAAVIVIAAVANSKDVKIDAARLIGTWAPKSPKKGELTSIEFAKDGKLIARADVAGPAARVEGTYKIDGNTLTFDVLYANERVKGMVTVISLTGEEMATRDKEGKVDSYKRVVAK